MNLQRNHQETGAKRRERDREHLDAMRQRPIEHVSVYRMYPIHTPLDLVPASVVGLMRSTEPANDRSPKPSIASSTAMPILISGMSLVGTIACNSIFPRSTMVNSGESKFTFSPGCTWRLAIVPDSGAVTTASRSAFFASCTWASYDFSVPYVTDRLLSALS